MRTWRSRTRPHPRCLLPALRQGAFVARVTRAAGAVVLGGIATARSQTEEGPPKDATCALQGHATGATHAQAISTAHVDFVRLDLDGVLVAEGAVWSIAFGICAARQWHVSLRQTATRLGPRWQHYQRDPSGICRARGGCCSSWRRHGGHVRQGCCPGSRYRCSSACNARATCAAPIRHCQIRADRRLSLTNSGRNLRG